MLLHYRSVFRVDSADPAGVARGPFAEWVAGHGSGPVDLSPGRRTIAEGLQVEVLEGRGTARYRLRRLGWPMRRITTLTAHCDAKGQGWLWLELEYEASATDVRGPRMQPPPLIKALLEETTGHDGMATLTNGPQRVTEAGLDLLIDILCDTERQVPVVVISRHPRKDPDEWAELARDLTADLVGVAAVYELTREATERLDLDPAFEDHKVFGGAVRTYLPGVDPASPDDARRHRVLTAARILEDPGRARKVLTALPWELARTRPLPEPLQRVEADGIAVERDAAVILQTVPMQKRPKQSANGQTGLLEGERTTELEKALAETLAEVARYKEEWREAKARSGKAEERAYAADRRAEAEILDHDATRAELDEALDQVRRLQGELVAAGLVERAYAAVPEEERTPRLLSVSELRPYLARLKRVRVEIDWEVAERLDDNFKAATWAAKAWRALRALDDYAAARAGAEFDRDFHAYCRQPPPGRTGISANAVAITESDDTRQNRRFAQARLFPVPVEVHPEGRVHMWAHIKLDSAGRTAPRIHFFDDTAGPTGLVHVGYIGPHLPNRQS